MTQHTHKIGIDDPLLTAYALGELEGAELARIEAAVLGDPELEAAVRTIRETSTAIESALALESLQMGRPAAAKPRRRRLGRLLEYPSLYFLVGGVAAACFAVLVTLQPLAEQGLGSRREYRRVPVPLEAGVPVENLDGDAHRLANASAVNVTEELLPEPSPAPAEPLRAPDAIVSREATPHLDLDLKSLGKPASALPEAETATPGLLAERNQSVEALPATPAASLTSASEDSAEGVGQAASGASVASVSPVPSAAEVSSRGPVFRIPALNTPWLGEAGAATVSGNRVSVIQQSLNWGGGSCMHPREDSEDFGDRPFVAVQAKPSSRLGLETGAAGLGPVREALAAGRRPERRQVRVEEMLNAFAFQYGSGLALIRGAQGAERSERGALVADVELASAPWAAEHVLVRVGVQAARTQPLVRSPRRLVLLAEHSGPFQTAGKGQRLLLEALRSWAGRVRVGDELAIVSLGREARLLRPISAVENRWELLGQIEGLASDSPSGSPMGTEELRGLLSGAAQLIWCTTGAVPAPEALAQVRSPLAVLSVGQAGASLSGLVDRESFRVDTVDRLSAARAALLEHAGEGAQVVAREARLELRFNPELVASYRIIGYEDREGAFSEAPPADLLSGQSFTALYELIPTDEGRRKASARPRDSRAALQGGEQRLLDLSLSCLDVVEKRRVRRTYQVLPSWSDWDRASDDFRLAASVAAFGMVLRDSPHKGRATLARIERWSRDLEGSVSEQERRAFSGLLDRARRLGIE